MAHPDVTRVQRFLSNVPLFTDRPCWACQGDVVWGVQDGRVVVAPAAWSQCQASVSLEIEGAFGAGSLNEIRDGLRELKDEHGRECRRVGPRKPEVPRRGRLSPLAD